jgi:predicted DNA-binding helix-hairpin-helix protein
MVVGATNSTDRDIIQRADTLYRRFALRRIYYTGFSPYPKADLRLPLAATPLVREHRLYQADWLIRHYGFDANEITTPDDPHLDLKADPKTQWANRHREAFPVDVNAAPREILLRVPGLGYRNVDRILNIRRYHRLILDDLRRLRISLKNTSPWIITADSLPHSPLTAAATAPAEQLSLNLFSGDSLTVASTLHGQL